MSLTYAQMQSIFQEVKTLAIGSRCSGVMSISPRSFIISLERDGITHHLLFSFQEGFLRFHFCSKLPIPLRNIPFVDILSENLEGMQIADCALVNDDRILSFSFQGRRDLQLIAEFLPKRPNCYLLDARSHILAALNPVEAAIYSVPAKPEQRPVDQGSEKQVEALESSAAEKMYAALEMGHLFTQQKKLAEAAFKKKLVKVEKRVEGCQKTLLACKNWHLVNHDGQLLQSNLFRMQKGMKEVIVADWELGNERVINVDPLSAPKDIVAAYFRRSKKLKAGEEHAVRLLGKAEEELALCLEQKRVLDESDDIESLTAYYKRYGESLRAIRPAAVRGKKEPAKPYHKFKSLAGIEIRVGKSAKDNDRLTFHCSNGLDLWLHARNYPGSHVVVHCQKGQELDDETLNDAAELALRYSKAKHGGEGEVCLTQVKGLTRVKGIPGKVMLSKHKILRLVLDNKRWLRLKGCA